MKLKTNCPACQVSLSVKPELVGRTVKCPACNHPFTIESAKTPTSEKSLDDAMGAWFAGDSAEESSTPPSSPSASLPSTVSRFEVREKLGEGGFGSVYRAWDPVLDRETALKVPHASRNVRKEYDRILNEAKAAARLRHPNIVAVFEVGTATEQPFIAAEFVQGKTLSSIMKDPETRAKTDQRQLVEWLIAVSRGLAYAHREGIVHRDVKPHNVLIDETGRALLADFGLAMGTETDSDARQNAIVGTLGYMSPEQASGDQSTVGPASDQYALGVILFEMLTGKRPFEGNSLSLIDRIINEETPRPSSVADNVNRDLECICMKVLSKQAASRFDSCDAFADDLQRWLDGELVEATRPTWLRRVVHWGRKRPQLAAWSIAGASLILLATGTTITIAIQQKLENDRLAAAAETAKQEITSSSQDAAAAKEALAKAEQERLTAQAKSEATEYAAELNRIRTAIVENRIEDAHQMLDRIPWNKRHVEHGLLRREAMGTPYVMRHGTAVKKLSWSHDGRILASIGRSRGISFWSGETGRPMPTRGDATANSPDFRRCNDAEFSPAGDLLWTLRPSAKSTVLQSWRISEVSGQLSLTPSTQSLTVELQQAQLQLDPSGNVACIVGNPKEGQPGLVICDLSQPELRVSVVPNGLPRKVTAAAFRSTGTELVCRTNASGDEGNPMIKYFAINYMSGSVTSVENFPPTAGTAAALSGGDEEMTLLPEYHHGASLHFEQYRGNSNGSLDDKTTSIEISKDVVISGFEDGRIESDRQFDRDWRGHAAAVTCSAQRPDGRCLASGDDIGEIRLWPTTLQTRFGVSQNQLEKNPLGRVSSSHDGALAACTVPESESGELLIWNTVSGEIVQRLPGHRKGIHLVCFHPVDDQLLSVDGEKVVRVWQLKTSEISHQWTLDFGTVADVAFSPNGKSLVIVGAEKPMLKAADTEGRTNTVEGIVTLWNPETGTQIRQMSGHTARVTRAAFVPDGSHLYTSSDDGSVRAWSVEDGKALANLSCEGYAPIDLAASDTMVAIVAGERCEVTGTGTTRLMAWQHGSDKQIWSIPVSDPQVAFRAMSFSDDGKRLVVVSDADVAIRDSQTGTHFHSVPIPLIAKTGRTLQELTFTAMVPTTEAHAGTKKVRKEIVEPQEETYTVQVNGQAETRTRTVNVPRTVFEDVPYTYNVTVMKPTNRIGTAAIPMIVRDGSSPIDAIFLPKTTGIAISGGGLGIVFSSEVPWKVSEFSQKETSIERQTLSPDGRILATFGKLRSGCEQCSVIDLWNAKTGDRLRSFRRIGEQIRAIVFHPSSGNLIIATDKADHAKGGNMPAEESSSTESWLLVIDSQSGAELQKITSESLASPVVELAVGAQSDTLLARSENGVVHVCDLRENGKIISAGAAAPTSKIALSSDGRLAILQESARVTVCLTDSPEKRWLVWIPQLGSEDSGFAIPVMSFELAQDGSQVYCFADNPYQPSPSAPILIDLAEVMKAMVASNAPSPVDLPSLPLSESSTWLQTPDELLYNEQISQYLPFSGLNVLWDASGQEPKRQFLTNLHGWGNVTTIVHRDANLYGNFRDASGNSTVLAWDTEATRHLQDRFRITTPESASVELAIEKPIDTTITVPPRIRLSPPDSVSPDAGLEHVPPLPSLGNNGQATPAPTRIEEAPAPPAGPATADRIAADWVRKFQARLILDVQGKRVDLPATSPLPGGTFVVTAIHVPESAKGVSDDGLELVGRLKSLTDLTLRTSTSQITDAGVLKLISLPSLRALNLHATKITDKSLEHLTAVKTLEWLDLGYNQDITDTGMDQLAKMSKLKLLNLASTRVTDTGLRKLVSLKQLISIDVTNLKMSDETVRFMKQQLPACEYYEGGLTKELFHPLLREGLAAYAATKREILASLVTKAAKEVPDDKLLHRKLKHLRSLLDPPLLQKAADISSDVNSIAVSQLQTVAEKTSWGPPQRNKIIPTNHAKEPFLQAGGEFFESGLYAHANSLYSLQLDGKWKSMSTKFGLQDGSILGSAVFVIKGDGKELFRSSLIKAGSIGEQKVDISNCKLLELITETSPDGGNSDWSLWLDPTLHR